MDMYRQAYRKLRKDHLQQAKAVVALEMAIVVLALAGAVTTKKGGNFVKYV